MGTSPLVREEVAEAARVLEGTHAWFCSSEE